MCTYLYRVSTSTFLPILSISHLIEYVHACFTLPCSHHRSRAERTSKIGNGASTSCGPVRETIAANARVLTETRAERRRRVAGMSVDVLFATPVSFLFPMQPASVR